MDFAQLTDWLIHQGRAADPAALLAGVCDRLIAAGVPVWRATLGLETLHPEESGSQFIWVDGALERSDAARAGILSSASYLKSPTYIVDETDEPFRCRLDATLPDMPLLQELRASGATDYCMYPLPFIDTTRTAIASFVTRAPDGFSDGHLGSLWTAARLLSPYAERIVLRRIAIDLLAAYLGPAAGRRVYDGHVERGDVETLKAAIWFCDLRGFTMTSEDLPRTEVVALLNRWFDAMGEAIATHGGEILKFMGDGMLAVFPVDGNPTETCDRAFDAALAARGNVAALDRELLAEGRASLSFGLALHLGEVEFGNVGTRHRLDFTVIGPAVNHASRLQDLTKKTGEPILASADFARATARPLRSIGMFELRGIVDPVEVYVP